MARSYNVSFNINGALDGSLLAALQNAANAMRGLGNAARAASANARASQAGLQGLATSLNSLQQAAQRYQALQAALRQTTADFGRSGTALEAAKAKFQADTQAAEELRRKLSDLRKELNQAKTAKIGESTGLKTLRQQMRELRRAYAEAKRAGDTIKTTQLKGQINSLGAAIQAQQQKVRQAAAAYKELSDKARQMKTELKAAEQAAAASGQGLSRARQDADRLRQSYQQQLAALNQLKASLTAAGFNTSNFAASESRLAADINRVNAALARQNELTNAQRASQQASQNMFNAYNNFQGALQTAETIAAPFKSSIENAMDFEHAMSRVKALTQSQNIREGNMAQVKADMKLLTQQARDLGATTMFTSTQAAQAMGYLGMAGWKTQQIYGTMPGMLDLAAAAGADLAQTADIVSDNMTAMGVPVEQAAHFMDVYAYALTNSNARLTDFGETMKYAAPVAKAYGSTLDETAAMVMMMANAGIKGSMAGTSLRMGLLRLAGPPKTATKEMAKLGLSLSDAQAGAEEAAAVIQSLGIDLSGATTSGEKMTRVLMQLHEKTKNLSQDEKLAAFKGIFGVNAETGWLALFDQGPEVFMKYVQGLRTADGYSKQVAATMLDDTRGALVMLQSAWDAFSGRIGDALLPAVKATIEAFTPMVTAAAQWIEQHPAVVQACAAITGALAGLVVAAAAVKLAFAGFGFIATSFELIGKGLMALKSGEFLGGLIGRIATLRTALFGLNGAATIGGWGAMFTVISTRATTAATAVRTFFASLTLGSVASGVTGVLSSIGTAIMGVTRAALGFVFSPVGVALMLLGAAAYYCYQNWDKVSAVFNKLASILGGALSGAISTVIASFSAMSSSGTFDALISSASRLASIVGGALVKAFAVFLTAAASAIAIVLQLLGDLVKFAAEALGGLMDVFGKLSEGDFSGAWEAWKSHGERALSNIKTAGEHVFDGVLKGAENVQQVLDALNMPNLPTKEVTARHAIHFDESGTAHSAPEAPATPESASAEAPALDTSATQSALDAVGDSAQNAATNMDAVNTATQNISQAGTNLQTLGTNSQTAGTNVQTLGTNSQTAGLNVQAVGNAAQATSPQVDALGTSSGTAQGNVAALGDAAGGAVGNISAMSLAAGDVASALSSKAAEIGAIHISVPTVSVGGAAPAAANYMGGIYRKGAFLTTFAERSAEAAIPLDGSRRAQDLWTQAGQILGLLPSTQPVTYETPRNRDETKYRRREVPTRRARRPVERARRENFAKPYETPRNLPQLPKIFTQTQPTTYDTTEIIKQTQDTLIRELPGKLISARASGKADGGLLGKLLGAFKPQATNVSFLPKIFTQTQPTTYNSQNQSAINNSMSHTLTMPQTFRQAQLSTYNALTQSATENSETRTLAMPRTFSQIQSQIYNSRSESLSHALAMSQMLAEPQASAYQPLAGDAPNQLISAQDTAGLVNKSATTSATTLNVTINVNISGNADEQTVRRGVESALPQLDDWFARYNEHMHEERRRSYA